MYKIFIGYDSREDIAYKVCEDSIIETTKAKFDIEIIPLNLKELRKEGHYYRRVDQLGSTEFTFSRFLVPYLSGFEGWALFIDCDFLFLHDVQELFKYTINADNYAVLCAKHDYKPKKKIKMDHRRQSIYPRKNWSSCVLWNCSHPKNKILTREFVNDVDTTGQYLHRFSWLKDNEIGEISHEWNWLVGWYKSPKNGVPKALHYTEGGPWFKDYEKCDYAIDWYIAERKLKQKKPKQIKINKFEALDAQKEKLFSDLLDYWADPNNFYFKNDIETIIKEIKTNVGSKVVAIDSEGGINYNVKGLTYDPILVNFVLGSQGYISNWDREEQTSIPLVIRGLGGGSRKAIKSCWQNNRTFYAVDTGYFGNWKSKIIHRVTKNALQNLGPIIDRPMDRAKNFGYKYKKFTPGKKILVCPPSIKVMETFDQPSPEEWVKIIKEELKKHTDRPIEIRLKPNRTERVTTKSIQGALQDDVYCLITYNSIAAVEALMEGKPAIVLGPNAASNIANTRLAEIESLNIPSKDEMDRFMAHLSYCQFTVAEMKSGFAWTTVNESS